MIPGPFSERALIFAPSGRDARVAVDLLREAGLACEIVEDMVGVERGLHSGAGLAVLAEEGLAATVPDTLGTWVANQPAWSDFPFIVLTRRGGEANPATQRLSELLGNVSFLERPFHPNSFISTVRMAVRARRRQYDARARLEELKDRQERLRFAQEAGDIGTFELFADTRMLSVSEQFCRIWGLSVRATTHLADLIALIEPEDRAAVRTTQPVLTGDALQYLEYRIRRPDTGQIRWIARRGEALPDSTTGKNRFFGIVYDITERKNAELALREREAFTRLLINSTSEAFYAIDRAGVTTLCNASFLRLLGFDESEVVGRKLHDVIHHSHPDGSPYPLHDCPIFRAAERGETAVVDDEAFFRKNGTAIPVEYRVAPIVVGGALQGAICTFVDITERKRAADELRQLNATLEQRVEERTRERDRMWRLSGDLMAVCNGAGRFLAVNQAWLTMLGMNESALLAADFLSLVHPEDVAATVIEISRLESAATTSRFENRCRHSNGSYLVVSWTAVSDEGQFYAIGRDMTQQRHMEDALRQSAKMEAVGQLTGGIAHDFNNLLQAIMAALDMMRWRATAGRPDDTERLASLAMTSAGKAASLIHRLLAFSRRQPLDPKPVSTNALVGSIEDLLRRTLGQSSELKFVLAQELWTTRCDPNQLESAILNLCINARDAMPHGGQLTVETSNACLQGADTIIAGANAGQYVCLSIADTGTGMETGTIAKAFDPFFTTKAPGEGTGLGLSMVYGFARQSEGDVKIYSQLGQGTTVKLYLPRCDDVAVEESATPEAVVEIRPVGQECILIVEDEASIRGVAVEVLKDLGFNTLEAADGGAGLRVLESDCRVDLLITDIGLPGMNGRTMADHARALRPNLPILFMTGYAENAALASGFLEPGMEMMTKPFSLSTLARRVQAMLRRD